MVLALPVLLFFLVVLLHPDFRKVSFWTALACAPAGIIAEIWLIPDYWDPRYVVLLASFPWRFGLEDIIITGAFAGISAAVFEYYAERRSFNSVPPITARTFLAMEGYGLFGCIIMIIGVHVLDLAAIHALFLSVFIILVLMVRSSISYVLIMIPLAVAIAVIYLVYLIVIFSPLFPDVFGTVWNLPNTWGLFLYGVPAEELVWAFLTALYCGIIYRIAATKPFPLGRRFWTDIYRKNLMSRTGGA